MSFAGLAILACVFLTLSGSADLSVIFNGALSIFSVSIVAALDVLCGTILLLRGREINLSITPKQEETNNNSN